MNTKYNANHLFLNENRCVLWIEQQIIKLSKQLDLEIEITQKEFRIGNFRADMYGIEHFSDRNVIIEIQQGSSDHKHLGQLLTYSSNNTGSIAIWITESFRDEHLAALRFLNNSNQCSQFYGVEIIQNKNNTGPEFKLRITPSSKISKNDKSIKERRSLLMESILEKISGLYYEVKFYNSFIKFKNKKISYQIKFHNYYNNTLILSAIVDQILFSNIISKNNKLNHLLDISTELSEEVNIIFHEIGSTGRVKLSADLLDQNQPDKDKVDWVLKTIKIFENLLKVG